jgi:hypothetical protein
VYRLAKEELQGGVLALDFVGAWSQATTEGDEESVRLLCKAMKQACTTRSAAVGLMGPLTQWRPALMGEVSWSAWGAFEDLRLHELSFMYEEPAGSCE